MKEVTVEMSGKKLTGHAGLVPVGKFVKKLGLKSLFETQISIERGANALYSVADALLITLVSTVVDLGLFTWTTVEYEYFCYVTSLEWQPWNVHRYYGQRAASENWIQWCKGQMGAASMLTQDFWANSALFQVCLLAYNLLVWLLWLTMRQKLREEPDTVRGWLIRVPAKLVKHAGRLVLRVSAAGDTQERWQALEDRLAGMSFA